MFRVKSIVNVPTILCIVFYIFVQNMLLSTKHNVGMLLVFFFFFFTSTVILLLKFEVVWVTRPE